MGTRVPEGARRQLIVDDRPVDRVITREAGRRPGEDLRGQGMASFLDEGLRWFAEMRGAAIAGDAEVLARAARELAGTAVALRAFPLEWVCVEIEARVRSGNVAAAGKLLPAVIAAWQRAESELLARGFHS